MKRLSVIIISALAFCMAGCGKMGSLEPRTGNDMPPKAYGQTSAQTAEALTTPSVQARPGRTDELLKRSERREDDPFDVPPDEERKPFFPAQTNQQAKPDPK